MSRVEEMIGLEQAIRLLDKLCTETVGCFPVFQILLHARKACEATMATMLREE